MKEISLTNSHLITQVSDEDWLWLTNYKLYLTNWGYANGNKNRKAFCVHIAIAKKMNLDCSNKIDHKDQNKLNNQRENLRPATKSQNQINTGLYSHNTSGLAGVTWDANREKWKAQIKVDQKMLFLGRFYSKEAAHHARLEAEKFYFGEFANGQA